MEQQVIRIVCEVCGLDPSRLQTGKDLIEYGIDSTRALEVLAECEDVFGLEISSEEAARLRTVDQIIAYIREHQAR